MLLKNFQKGLKNNSNLLYFDTWIEIKFDQFIVGLAVPVAYERGVTEAFR